MRSLDQTRLIDHASGWHDQGVSDVKSLHVYFKPFRFHPDKHGRAVVLSEFGGYTLPLPGHRWGEKVFGYRRFSSPEALEQAFTRLYEKEILPAIPSGLSATVYTQLSDVEDECNGMMTYDRSVIKIRQDTVKSINQRLLTALKAPAAP